jgi:hypothetical protein
VNVELPISGENIPWSEEVDEVFRHQLLEEWGVYAAHFWHNGKWWVRCSAQIWNHVSPPPSPWMLLFPNVCVVTQIRDFDVLGRALLAVCKEIRERFETQTGGAKL